MTMYIFASHATVTGAGEKKTGPSRFSEDFFDRITHREFETRIGKRRGNTIFELLDGGIGQADQRHCCQQNTQADLRGFSRETRMLTPSQF
jgi:hypothetical protein